MAQQGRGADARDVAPRPPAERAVLGGPASPIDLIPEFLPIIGPLDDVVVVALALRYAGRHIPREALFEAWPGDPKLLDRLLGPPRADAEETP